MNITDALKTDISLMGDMQVTASGDLMTVSGLNNLQQALFHRLITSPGALVHRPTYGVGILQYQNAPTSFSSQQAIAEAIKDQFEQDPRVQAVVGVSITSEDETPETVTINVTLTPVGYTELSMNFTPFTGN
jgi:phage baseplate assembly protein W